MRVIEWHARPYAQRHAARDVRALRCRQGVELFAQVDAELAEVRADVAAHCGRDLVLVFHFALAAEHDAGNGLLECARDYDVWDCHGVKVAVRVALRYRGAIWVILVLVAGRRDERARDRHSLGLLHRDAALGVDAPPVARRARIGQVVETRQAASDRDVARDAALLSVGPVSIAVERQVFDHVAAEGFVECPVVHNNQ